MTEKWDDLFPEITERKKDAELHALAFAQKYLVFVGPTADPRARELLEHWTATIRLKRIPPGATPQEYAAYNGVREFVEGLNQQAAWAIQTAQAITARNAPRER